MVLEKISWQSQEYLLVNLAYHALTESDPQNRAVKSCADFRFIFQGIGKDPLENAISLADFPSVDLSFCLVPISNRGLDLSRLEIASMNFDIDLLKGTPLVTLGRGASEGEKPNLTLDRSSECQTLSNEDNLLYFSPSPRVSQWVLPVGCDVAPGDSGAGVFTTKSELVGFVSSIATYSFKSQAEKVFDGRLKGENLLRESTRMIPVKRVAEEVQRKLDSGEELSDLSRHALEKLIK